MSSPLLASNEWLVNTTTAKDQAQASVATLADGSFVIVWQSQQPYRLEDGRYPYDNDLFAQHYDARGNVIDGETLLVHQTLDQTQASIAATTDGGYAVAYASKQDYDGRWRNFDLGVASKTFDAQGHTLSATAWSTGDRPGNQDTPSITVLADGSLSVVYTDSGSAEAGLPAGVAGAGGGFIAGAQDAVVAALNGGGTAVSWTAGEAVFAQAFTAGAGGAVQLASGASHTAIAALGGGGFVVAWQAAADGQDIYMQRFDAKGHGMGAAQRVNGSTAGDQATPAITALGDGGWAVAWVGADSDGRGVFYQRYDAAGVAQGGEAALNADKSGDQFDPSLAATRDGGFVAAWTSMQADGSLDVHARHFAHTVDLQGHEGMAYRLYQAAFDRAPDLPGLGYHTTSLDGGVNVSQVAAQFIASPEFASRYGALDDAAFVTQLYQNVLHRGPDENGLAYHLGDLAHGLGRSDVLVHFSESPENQALVVGSLQAAGFM